MTNENDRQRDRLTRRPPVNDTGQVRGAERAVSSQRNGNVPLTDQRVSIWLRADGLRFLIHWPRTPARRMSPAASTTTIPVGADLTTRLTSLAWAARISQRGPQDLVVRAITATEFAVCFQPAGRSDLPPTNGLHRPQGDSRP